MTKTNVLSDEYTEFQERIYALYENWNNTISTQTIVKKEEVNGKAFPLLPQLELQMDEKDYHSFLSDLFTVVKEHKPELSGDLDKLAALLDNETVNKWFTEAVIVNTYYFSEFAEKNNLPDWLPLFAAEHAIRPYLQKVAAELKDARVLEGHTEGCPVCGEPARLAMINKAGKKEITCPRCHYAWGEKKISCAHCGTDDHEQIVILKVEGEDSAEIYTCKKCKGYTKVINTNALIKVPTLELLDLKTIHLDYIAQDKGYGMKEIKDSH